MTELDTMPSNVVAVEGVSQKDFDFGKISGKLLVPDDYTLTLYSGMYLDETVNINAKQWGHQGWKHIPVIGMAEI